MCRIVLLLVGKKRKKQWDKKQEIKTAGENYVSSGAGWKTHKESGCQKHPVSHRVFLVDNVIVAKAMHSKDKYGRVSIFVISKSGQ